MVSFLVIWGVFTFFLFLGTLRLNRALQFIFASLTILSSCLRIGDPLKNAAITSVAGYEGHRLRRLRHVCRPSPRC